ncbi:HD domain-containing protein [Candidatus Campbellbacteria bacterium]|nr:MAG: HD domain-containing protein [Candidatus Campbellbacteria bacterium]
MNKKMQFLTAAENRASFFRRVALYYPTLDWRYKLIEQAYNDAKDAFRGKYRDDQKTRYFEHIRAVALILLDYLRIRDYELIVAALLHDIVEDIPSWTIERVRVKYGERVALYVQYLTKPSKEEYADRDERELVYHTRFDAAPREFFLIKLADRLHNLLTLYACTPEKRQRKIVETRRYYLPHAEKHLILMHEIEDALAEL